MKPIRIGISGHRNLVEPDKLMIGISAAFSQIATIYSAKDWLIYSSLAEGADCMIAQYVLEHSLAKLIVPLPLPENGYLDDFSSPKAKKLFRELFQKADQVIELYPQSDKDSSYLASGEYIVDNSDIFITVWDGQPARGKGGTGDIINLVRKKQLPLAWIWAGGQQGQALSALSQGQVGDVIFERFPSDAS